MKTEIKRFYYYPIWNVEKYETFLQEMNRNGFRLKKVNFTFWHTFVSSKNKEVEYFCTYYSKGRLSMTVMDSGLMQNYNANSIDCEDSSWTVYRIVKHKQDLFNLKITRADHLRITLWQKFFLSALFFSMFCIAIVLTTKYYYFDLIVGGFLAIVFGVRVLWLLYGLQKQRKLCKKYQNIVLNKII